MKAQIIVPALTLRTADGKLDLAATAQYAERAVATWVDAFILSGSTTRGDLFTVAERAAILDLWLNLTDSARLLACTWCADDVREAVARGVRPMAVMRGLRDEAEACAFLAALPEGAYVYSHPMYTPTVLDAHLCAIARQGGYLPAGAKLAKVSTADIRAIRAAAGPDFALWDGSSRHVGESVAAGAAGVVATPARQLDILQRELDQRQAELDRLPTREARTHALTRAAVANLG